MSSKFVSKKSRKSISRSNKTRGPHEAHELFVHPRKKIPANVQEKDLDVNRIFPLHSGWDDLQNLKNLSNLQHAKAKRKTKNMGTSNPSKPKNPEYIRAKKKTVSIQQQKRYAAKNGKRANP